MSEDNKLYRKATAEFKDRPVCDIADRTPVIAECHKLGHFGVLRTAAMVAERFYWGGIVQDCKNYIRNCHVCSLEHTHFSQPQQLQSIPVNDHSFYRVGIDLVGPLTLSKSGNRYIVVAMDYLTKWPEVAAIPDKKASTVTEIFLENIVSRHGCPKEVLSDNIGEFMAEFDSVLQRIHIDHRLTSTNHPQANGLVERFNGTLCAALRKCAAENTDDWDKWIPSILLGYRSTVQASTRYTPFFMLYARQPTLPLGPNHAQINLEEMTAEEAAESMLDKTAVLSDTTTQAVANISKAQERQKRDYKAKRKHVEPTTLKKGDFVVIKSSSRKGKLDPSAQPDIYQLVEFTNEQKNTAIVMDASQPPKKWKENVSNLGLYQHQSNSG